jgi:hypothetical protein
MPAESAPKVHIVEPNKPVNENTYKKEVATPYLMIEATTPPESKQDLCVEYS